jgi:hypothetical protein
MKVPEGQMQELLLKAMLDPQLAARLMTRADAKGLTAASSELAKLYAATRAATTGGMGAGNGGQDQPATGPNEITVTRRPGQ